MPLAKQARQLGDVHGYAPSLIESKSLGDSGIVRVGVAVDIGDGLAVGVHDLKSGVYRLDFPWWWESSQGEKLAEPLRAKKLQSFVAPQ